MATIKTGIIGGAGYTGGELIRLLLNHPQVELAHIHSRTQGGKPVADAHPDLLGDTAILFTGSTEFLKSGGEIDVLFLCVGHGEARKFLEETKVHESIRVIDLSQDFRLVQTSSFSNRKFIYGLPELDKKAIISAQNIANPGCFATALQLGLLPIAKARLLGEVYTTGVTGSTGAGQSLSQTSHFSWRANNIQAYKTLTHQHLGEIGESLGKLGAKTVDINFVPWRGDFTRGIFISSLIDCKWTLEKLNELYREFYVDAAFTHVSGQSIFLKQVVNTNKCAIHLEKVGSKLVVHTAIDNLLKGASGQAVQNMNLMFGLDEKEGLRLKAIAF